MELLETKTLVLANRIKSRHGFRRKASWCTRTYRVSDAHVKKFAKVAMNLAVKNGDVSFSPFNRRQRKRGGHFGLPFLRRAVSEGRSPAPLL